MGDRTTTYNDCPKCGGKGTFECYEALSSNMKFDECSKCGYAVRYDIDDAEDVITIKRITPELTEAERFHPSDEVPSEHSASQSASTEPLQTTSTAAILKRKKEKS